MLYLKATPFLAGPHDTYPSYLTRRGWTLQKEGNGLNSSLNQGSAAEIPSVPFLQGP